MNQRGIKQQSLKRGSETKIGVKGLARMAGVLSSAGESFQQRPVSERHPQKSPANKTKHLLLRISQAHSQGLSEGLIQHSVSVPHSVPNR